MQVSKTLCVIVLASAGCTGVIEDAGSLPTRGAPTAGIGGPVLPGTSSTATGQVPAGTVPPATGATAPGSPGSPGSQGAQGPAAGAWAPTGTTVPPATGGWNPGMGIGNPGASAAGAAAPGGTVAPTDPNWDPSQVNPQGQSVGMGMLDKPALGPAPTYFDKVGGEPFVLLKNWDFGSEGTIAEMDDLIAEFQFHDQFNTIANGSNYGSVIVAPNAKTAISASNLGLPNNKQPVDDPARPYREFTPDAIRTYVRPLNPNATSISATKHDSGNGSFMAKWMLPKGGSRLKQDLLWESRVRIPTPAKAFWFSLWTAGQKWNKGAEMDVVESFGTPNIGDGAKAFHVNSVGGRDKYAYKSWGTELQGVGVPAAERDLENWHVFTWVYLRDDTYKVYYDGYLVQEGSILWTLGGTASGEQLNMQFLFDFSWGHTQVQEVNITLPASELPIVYELDYSRVYVRE